MDFKKAFETLRDKILTTYHTVRLFFKFWFVKAFVWSSFRIGNILKGERQTKFRLWFRRVSGHQWLWGRDQYKAMLEETQDERRRELKAWAYALCPACYGRGYTGFNLNSNTYVVCECVRGNIQRELDKENKIQVASKEDIKRFNVN